VGDQVIIDHLIKLRPGAPVMPTIQQDNTVIDSQSDSSNVS
jgi:hypothetical protein